MWPFGKKTPPERMWCGCEPTGSLAVALLVHVSHVKRDKNGHPVEMIEECHARRVYRVRKFSPAKSVKSPLRPYRLTLV